jgi:hypothetical protein
MFRRRAETFCLPHDRERITPLQRRKPGLRRTGNPPWKSLETASLEWETTTVKTSTVDAHKRIRKRPR